MLARHTSLQPDLLVLNVEFLELSSKLNDRLALGNAIAESFVVVMERWIVPMLSQKICSSHHPYQLHRAIRYDGNATDLKI